MKNCNLLLFIVFKFISTAFWGKQKHTVRSHFDTTVFKIQQRKENEVIYSYILCDISVLQIICYQYIFAIEDVFEHTAITFSWMHLNYFYFF